MSEPTEMDLIATADLIDELLRRFDSAVVLTRSAETVDHEGLECHWSGGSVDCVELCTEGVNIIVAEIAGMDAGDDED